MAFPFWGDPWLYLWLDPSRKFQPLCHHGSPWVTVGHCGSPCIFLSRFLCSLQRKASSRCAKTAGPFVEVQGLGARCWLQIPHVSHVNNCKFGLRSTVLTVDWASNLVPVPDTFPKGSIHQLNWDLSDSKWLGSILFRYVHQESSISSIKQLVDPLNIHQK